MAADGTLRFDTTVDTSGVQDGCDQMTSQMDAASVAGVAAIAAISAKLVELAGKIVDVGSEFETSFAKASTLFGDTKVDTDNLTSAILEMSNATGLSAAELNESLYQAMSAGVPVTEDMSEALNAVETAAKLAKGGFTDTASAMDIMTTAANSYSDAGYSMEQISDLLIMTQNKGKTTVDELASSLGRVLPIASGFGVSLEDVSASMATLTANGISTAESTTYLKSMLNELGDSGSTVSSVLTEKTGKSFTQLMADGYSMGDVLDILMDSANGDATAFMELWSSSEAGTAALSMANTGAEAYNKTLNTMKESTGATEEAYQTMADTFESKSDRMKQMVTNVGIEIWNGLEPAISAICDGILWLCDLLEPLEPIIAPVVAALLTFGTVVAVITAVTNGVKLLSTALTALTMNPVTLVIAAIAALVVAFVYLWNNCDAFREFWINLWEKVKEIASTVWEAIKNFFTAAWEAISTTASTIWNGIKDFFTNLWNNIKTIFTTVVNAISTFLSTAWNAIKTTVTTVFNAVKSFFETIWNGIKTVVTNVVTAIQTAISAGFTVIKTVIETIVTTIKTIIQNVFYGIVVIIDGVLTTIKDTISTVWNTIKTTVETVINAIKTVITSIFNAIKAFIQGDMEAVKENISTAWEAIKTAVSTVVNAIKTVISTVFNAIKSIIETVINTVSSVITTTWNTIKTTFTNALNTIKTTVTTAFNAIKTAISTAINAAKTTITTVFNAIKSTITSVLNAVKSTVTSIWNGIKSGITSAVNSIKSAVTNAFNSIKTGISNALTNAKTSAVNICKNILTGMKNIFSNVGSTFASIGKNIIQGIINGITGMVSSLYNSIKNALSGLVSKAKSALGIGSPSKVFAEEVGEWIPPGIGTGVEDSMPELQKTADAEMADLAQRMKATVDVETAKVEMEKNTAATYKVEQENGQAFDDSKTEVEITGETHVHVDLDGKEVGNATTPFVDKNMGRIDTHKKRGG